MTLSERQGAEFVAWEQAVAYHKGVCFCRRTGSVLDMQSEVFADLLGVCPCSWVFAPGEG